MKEIEKEVGLKLDQGRGSPVYLSAWSNLGGKSSELVFEIDSGADRSIVTMSEVERLGLKLRRFRKPKMVVGVGGQKINCENYAIVCLRLTDVNDKPLILNVLVYVFDCDTPNLLGSDIMRYIGAKIDFEQRALFVGGA